MALEVRPTLWPINFAPALMRCWATAVEIAYASSMVMCG